MFSVTWLGQGGFLLKEGDYSLAIDPYLSDLVERLDGLKRLVPAAFPPEKFHPNALFFTHEHIDHLDTDAIALMPKENVVFYASAPSKATLLDPDKHLGVDPDAVILTEEGKTFSAGPFTIRTVWADHTPGSMGLLVSSGNFTVYFTGDTLYSEKLGDGIHADCIECCINGRWGNMNAAEAARVAVKVGARLAIPNHYGMFKENTADPEDFFREMRTLSPATSLYQMEYALPFVPEKLLREVK